MPRRNPKLLELAKQCTDENDHATALSFVAQYVGYKDAEKAFLAIRNLHLIDGELLPDVFQLRERWRASLRGYVEKNAPSEKAVLIKLC